MTSKFMGESFFSILQVLESYALVLFRPEHDNSPSVIHKKES